ncbi:lambda exonuclease family protein [Hydrocarboniphaga effusa]|uniref:lambda exonuclease family protein n=1 Tax=Hydrocarboniphaga effusa TaxID=243629 RepID=UPI00398BBE92
MIFHDVQQNTETWESLRIGKATGSNFGKFMANDGKAFGEPAKRYALQLALERITGKKAEFSFTNDDMERGHQQEPIARMLYEEECFVDVTNGGFFDCGEYGDSPDGLVGKDGIVEIKSVIAPTHYANLQRGTFDPSYRWQMVGHLDCSGRDWVDFVSYCSEFPESKRLLIYRLWRRECQMEIQRLRARRAEFLALVSSIQESIELLEAA